MTTMTTETTFHHYSCTQDAPLSFWPGKHEQMVTCPTCGRSAPATALLEPTAPAPEVVPPRRPVIPPVPATPHAGGWPTHRGKARRAKARRASVRKKLAA